MIVGFSGVLGLGDCGVVGIFRFLTFRFWCGALLGFVMHGFGDAISCELRFCVGLV